MSTSPYTVWSFRAFPYRVAVLRWNYEPQKQNQFRKKTTRKTTKRSTSATAKKPKSQPALEVIDKGARFLKQAILRGEAETEEGRKALKKHALSFVEEANKKLAAALDGTASTVSRGLKKL